MTRLNKITFCINTAKNELGHIKLLFKSLYENLSTLEHEILVFVDSDNEGTFEWLLTQKELFLNLKILKNHLPIPYGYQRNINEMFLQAENQIVSYLQSDMVICKDYDLEVLKHLKANMVLCSTRIEPPLHPSSGEKHTRDFGLDPDVFNLSRFTEEAEVLKQEKITEYFFAPFTLYKDVWNNIGGHDTRFRRSREDSDILTRLVLNGTKIIQVWNALVYHFTCTSSRGKAWFDQNNTQAQEKARLQQQADQVELSRFFRKWGRFNHSLVKLKYYNIAARISGDLEGVFDIVEPFFTRVEVCQDLKNYFLNNQKNVHDLANTLVGIDSKTWQEYSYMFAQEEFEQRFTAIEHDDIIIDFSLDRVNKENYDTFITQLQDIIETVSEPGVYEYDIFTITVNRVQDSAGSKIKITNPTIKKEHLYTIH